MRRLAALLLVVSGLGLVTAPVEATGATDRPRLTISRTSVASGTPVVLRGRLLAPRSRVVLQRRTPSAWRSVAARRSTDRGVVRFRLVPPDGDQRYRLQAPGQRGRAGRSPAASVRVRWQPTLTLTSTTHATAPGGAVTTSVTGASSGLSGVGLRREVRSADGAWRAAGTTTTGPDGTWTDTFASEHGDLARYVAPGDGARLPAGSTTVVVDGPAVTTPTPTPAPAPTPDPTPTPHPTPTPDPTPTPTPTPDPAPTPTPTPEPDPDPAAPRLEVGTTTSVVLADGVASLDLLVDLDAGQSVTVLVTGGGASAALTAPSGAPVPGSDGPSPVTVTATEPGDHVLRLARGDAAGETTAAVTLSEPVVTHGSLDGPGVDLATTLPGQRAELWFEATGGTLVSEHAVTGSCCEPPPGQVTLIDPTGEPVARLGRLARQGHTWLLPDVDGTYVLRVTTDPWSLVDRHEQTVLTGAQVTATLDGEPGHVTLDRPGEVALVRTTVPAGLDVRLSDTGPDLLQREVLAPDGSAVPVHSTTPDLRQTQAGTYVELVSYDGSAEVDLYASTPLELALVADGSTPYDLGPAPSRLLRGRLAATPGRTASVEVLDPVGLCARGADLVSGDELVAWMADVEDQPSVLRTSAAGDVVLGLSPCEREGVVRIQDVTVVDDELVSTDGVTTTTRAALAAPTPGRLMVVAHRVGDDFSDWVTLRPTASTFPTGTGFSLAHGAPELSLYRAFGMVGDPFPLSYNQVRGEQLLFVYAGPTATGTLDLEIEVQDR